MNKLSTYIARKPDNYGYIEYPDEEHETWRILYERQIDAIKGRACAEFLEGITILGLSSKKIPQLNNITVKLKQTTGWSVTRVPALISFDQFFALLANRQFPVATFIRSRKELDYLQEPDIFHEIFGHCPLLTNPSFASLTEAYGKLGLSANKEERTYLARLYWMTVEFGLIQSSTGLRIYGGGILSSYKETIYSLENNDPEKLPFDVMTALRSPYRIDHLQSVYFIIQGFSELHAIFTQIDLIAKIRQAILLGVSEPKFSSKQI